MHRTLPRIFIAFFFCFGSSFSLLCPRQASYEPLDIDRIGSMKGTFYDVTDIPYFPNDIDCWDYHSFVPIGDGLAMNMTQHVEGRPTANLDVYVHFLHNGDGTYRMSKEHLPVYLDTIRESVAHKATPEMIAVIEANTEAFFNTDIFFKTDYENYFMFGWCLWDTDLYFAIKNKRVYPTAQDTLNFWNVYIENGEIPTEPVEFKDVCVLREDIGEEVEEESENEEEHEKEDDEEDEREEEEEQEEEDDD